MEKGHSFFAIGINYKKADISLRSKFSLSSDQIKDLLEDAKEKNIKLFVVSTCNRTEIFGTCQYSSDLIQLLCTYSSGSKSDFITHSYTLAGDDAVQHLFRLGTGLDSQILGDFEIIGQLKKSFTFAKEVGATDAYLERLMNDVIRTSKQVKNETDFSTKAASVAYAAVQWIRNAFKESTTKSINITLFGTGEIGSITCANLVKHFPNNSITLVNRTQERAQQISEKFHVNVAPIEELKAVLKNTDVLIVATNAEKPTIADTHISDNKMVIIDLSIPKNVELAKPHPHIQFVTLDDLTLVAQEGIECRKLEIPKVEAIIEERIADFEEWVQTRNHKDVVQAFKNKLKEIQTEELTYHSKKIAGFKADHVLLVSDKIIQKVTKQFVQHLKTSGDEATKSAKMMNEIFKLEI